MIDKLILFFDTAMHIIIVVTIFRWTIMPEDIVDTKHLAVILAIMLWLSIRRDAHE
jgi:hypothetical protein